MGTTTIEYPAPEATPARSRRRRPAPVAAATAIAIAIALLALAAGLGLTARAGGGDVPAPAEATPAADTFGSYRFDGGSSLLLWGEHAPRYELDGTVTFLRPAGTDTFAEASGEGTLAVQRDAAGTVTGALLERPGQAPAPAVRDGAYSEHEVAFGSAGAELAGTLLLPAGPGPHPAVVIVHGAEPATRDNYRLLGAHLARGGVAALIYDKRGVGASTGDLAAATFADLTADALAGVAALAADDRLDARRVGLAGMSQGGWVVAQAAAGNPDVAFVVALSASGFSPADQQAWLQGSMLAARGFDARWMATADRVSRMLYSSLDLVEAGIAPPMPHVPGFWFHALDPYLDSTALWERVEQPVLGLWGGMDCQVPAHDSARRIAAALARGGNTDVTLRIVPEADHGFTVTAPCAHETGMAAHHQMRYAEEYLSLPARWITGLRDGGEADSGAGVETAGAPDGAGVLGWHVDPPAPAPWYGSIAVQAAWVVLLLGAFALVGCRWAASAALGRLGGSRRRASRFAGLTGGAGLAGLASTVVGAAALTEVAMLGDTHAAFLAGGPTVAGTSVLLGAARALVALTVALAAVAVAAAVRGRGDAAARPERRGVVLTAAAVAALAAWAAYWGFFPVP